MATHIGIGFSDNIDVENAAKDAAFKSKTNIGVDRIDLAIVFSTSHYSPQEYLPVINKILNNVNVVGSVTRAIILTNTIKTKGISVLTFSSDDIDIGIGSIENIALHNSTQAGVELARNCLSNYGKQPRKAFISLVDGKHQLNTNLLKGIQSMLGNVFPIIGAASSDDFNNAKTYQIYQNKVIKNSATGIIMGGQLHMGIGNRHGWRPLGKPRVINKSSGNIIHSIDGKKACSIYEEYFGQDANVHSKNRSDKLYSLYPLGIPVEGGEEYLVKNAIDILPDGSIVCQGDVPIGSIVHLMISNKDFLRQSTSEAAWEAKKSLSGRHSKFVLVFESMARLKMLGRSATKEIQKISEVFGNSTPIFGMYTSGEICPYQMVDRYKRPFIQNQSIAVVAVS